MSQANVHGQAAGTDQRAATEKHNRVLLHALQIAHPVLYQQRQHFIHTLTNYQHGGRIETTVYLTGDPKPLRPEEVTLAAIPAAPDKHEKTAATTAQGEK